MVYSLKICYECGFVPIGVFPAMIAKLVGQASSTVRLSSVGNFDVKLAVVSAVLWV